MNDCVEINNEFNKIRLETKTRRTTNSCKFKLGEEIANGVRYFGGDRKVKGNLLCRCICPKCDEVWEATLANVIGGYTKSCGCKATAQDSQ